ncbi:MAG: GrpB family protein, partial [Thermomicrobiales bacterium]|nr:GrpB family protein [Thermomicrobiales bacterium]
MPSDSPIGEYIYLDYSQADKLFHLWDARYPTVATQVAELIKRALPDATVEHIGSTAVPGCHGKGVVDLLLLYKPGRLAAARDALDTLGFQRQRGLDPFPEERPMRVGSIDYDGDTFRLHVHVVAEDSDEAATLIAFRERLRADPDLLATYVERKRAVIADGAPDNVAYNQGKETLIR